MSDPSELELVRPAHVELLAVLQAHSVDCVLVGGVALQLHGASHTTMDVDVVVAVDPTNHARIDEALQNLRARPVGTSERGTKFDTRCGELELLSTTSGVGGYDGWIAAAERVTVAEGVSVMLAAAADIERNKNAAGREKDAEHIELLGAKGGRTLPGRGEQLLGPRPQAPAPARRWEAVSAMVDRYCEQYGLALPEPAERPPGAPQQLSDWRRVTRMVDQVLATQDAGASIDAETVAARAVAAANQPSSPRGAALPPSGPTAARRSTVDHETDPRHPGR